MHTKEEKLAQFGRILDIMDKLRAECPWNHAQTVDTLRPMTLEEVYELSDAILKQSDDDLKKELGDVLLQVVFHCRIEEEAGSFRFDDVCDEICKKLILRHPHVFGEVKADSTAEVLKNWDAIKMDEKGQETYTDTLNQVAKSLPSLMRAQKVGKRAMRAGMDFRSAKDAMACIDSEKAELERAVAAGDTQNIDEEMGDLLFSCVNAARHLGVNAELALKASTDKFIKRFSVTEQLVSAEGLDMKDLPIEKLDIYWDKAKKIIMEEHSND